MADGLLMHASCELPLQLRITSSPAVALWSDVWSDRSGQNRSSRCFRRRWDWEGRSQRIVWIRFRKTKRTWMGSHAQKMHLDRNHRGQHSWTQTNSYVACFCEVLMLQRENGSEICIDLIRFAQFALWAPVRCIWGMSGEETVCWFAAASKLKAVRACESCKDQFPHFYSSFVVMVPSKVLSVPSLCPKILDRLPFTLHPWFREILYYIILYYIILYYMPPSL